MASYWFEPETVSMEFGGRALSIETGRLAKQAAGAAVVTYGETVGALHQIWRQGYVTADFRAEQDRVLAAMRRNTDGARQGLDTEFLHDLRVAVRRTRAALAQYREVLPAATTERLAETADDATASARNSFLTSPGMRKKACRLSRRNHCLWKVP